MAANSVVVPFLMYSFVIVPQRPFFIGRPGWVLSACIWLFSSIERTTACAGGPCRARRCPAGLVANCGSLDSLNRRVRCGCKPSCARCVAPRRTDALDRGRSCGRPVRRPHQADPAWARGDDARHNLWLPAVECATAASCRSMPATRSVMKRSCQRQTAVLLTPVWRMISAVPQPSAVSNTIWARQTCFCGLFRSATIASSCLRSLALTATLIPVRIPRTRMPAPRSRESSIGLNCQILSTSRGIRPSPDSSHCGFDPAPLPVPKIGNLGGRAQATSTRCRTDRFRRIRFRSGCRVATTVRRPVFPISGTGTHPAHQF